MCCVRVISLENKNDEIRIDKKKRINLNLQRKEFSFILLIPICIRRRWCSNRPNYGRVWTLEWTFLPDRKSGNVPKPLHYMVKQKQNLFSNSRVDGRNIFTWRVWQTLYPSDRNWMLDVCWLHRRIAGCKLKACSDPHVRWIRSADKKVSKIVF